MTGKKLQASEILGGYAHPAYVQSLGEFGTPYPLRGCSGWILKRAIPGTEEQDAMGAYPVFSCGNWEKLSADLAGLENLVSFAAVLDPFGNYDQDCLMECFPDLILPFKQHFVTELSKPVDRRVSSHHRRNARKALQQINVEVSENPSDHLEEWLVLYNHLIQRHTISDIRTFSECSFAQQLKVPGIVMFRALHKGKAVGMLLWFAQGDVAYYHLGAYSPSGYNLNASFALFLSAIEYFSNRNFQWLNLGAGAGMKNDDEDGLSRFKRGWSTGTRTAFFCGRILDDAAYARLSESTGNLSTNYFPAYRKGEFCKKETPKKTERDCVKDQPQHDEKEKSPVEGRAAGSFSTACANASQPFN